MDHFGLVAGVFDQLGISEVIDNCLPKSRHHKLSHSQVLKAMVLNGLGFVGQRLYLFPSFFENLPVDKLLGEGIVAADLNDDVLGRTFDAIYKYDPTNLFNEIVLKVMDRVDFDTKLLHADTANQCPTCLHTQAQHAVPMQHPKPHYSSLTCPASGTCTRPAAISCAASCVWVAGGTTRSWLPAISRIWLLLLRSCGTRLGPA